MTDRTDTVIQWLKIKRRQETTKTEKEWEQQDASWAVGGIKQINASRSAAASLSESQDYS